MLKPILIATALLTGSPSQTPPDEHNFGRTQGVILGVVVDPKTEKPVGQFTTTDVVIDKNGHTYFKGPGNTRVDIKPGLIIVLGIKVRQLQV